MATYKVIQDIESEDKLLGPLSFRQFIYFLIAAFLGFLNFMALANGAWPVLIILVPPMIFCLFFAWPWSPDQPTEVWALARIRYYFKPRKRLWNQSGVKEFVTVTAPKKIEKIYTDGLSQTEVRSRLEALSSTIDTRGWAVKGSTYTPSQRFGQATADDRLLQYSTPMEVSDIHDEDDILDERNNATAQHMNQLIEQSSQQRRQEVIDRMNAPVEASTPVRPEWFQRQTLQPQTGSAAASLTAVPVPSVTSAQATQPVAALAVAPAPTPATKPQPDEPDAAILNLAQDNNLDVATLAREAKRVKGDDTTEGEVVISLR